LVAGVGGLAVVENTPVPSLLESLELLDVDEAVVGRTVSGMIVGETPKFGAGIGEVALIWEVWARFGPWGVPWEGIG